VGPATAKPAIERAETESHGDNGGGCGERRVQGHGV
jgi:hypothetical protein